MIFGHLPDGLFMVFSGTNRALYAESILALYRAFYKAPDAVDVFKPEWFAVIRGLIEANPALAAGLNDNLEPGEEAPKDNEGRAGEVYRQLKKAGWLREKQKHLRTAVDMPTAAVFLCEALDRIDRNVSESIAGVIGGIAAIMAQIKKDPARNAHALGEARRSAESFIRRLRAIRSSLDEIDEMIMGAKDLNERLTNFIDIFVGKLVIQDFKAVMTSNHPYRRRFEIMSAIADIRANTEAVQAAAKAIFDAGMAANVAEAENKFRTDLNWLHGCFDKIDALFERITDHRTTLEGRLRNTIRYIDRSSPERAAKMLNATKTALALREEMIEAGEDPEEPGFAPIPLLERHGVWSEKTLATPAEQRREPEARPVKKITEPPEVALLRRLKRAYERRFEPSSAAIIGWLEQRIEAGTSCYASAIQIETLDDFLMLDAVRLLAIGARFGSNASLPGIPGWSVKVVPGQREDDWAAFANFEISRDASKRRPAQKE
ncbi:MAG TPA: Wadjet anti-phage system protein JetA family protein [Dongiaceae bacterium]|nr:Wadjet anti-phage system protein JetA family protein [Dongiaceae bacterium]